MHTKILYSSILIIKNIPRCYIVLIIYYLYYSFLEVITLLLLIFILTNKEVPKNFL